MNRKRKRRSSVVEIGTGPCRVTADTNRKVIGSKLPNQYLPELIAANGENNVRAMMESHLISACHASTSSKSDATSTPSVRSGVAVRPRVKVAFSRAMTRR